MLRSCMRLAAGFFFLAVLIAGAPLALRADDILFIGNSFTYGASVPDLPKDGGVPALFQAIARAKGQNVTVTAVTAGGQDWTYHLAQPRTASALQSKVWTWVVLQDFSTRPTRIGNIPQFMQDGATFSDRIAQNSPNAGILLYETWARPPGSFYQHPPGNGLSGSAQMMSDLHDAYGNLQRALAAQDHGRPVRVALVGTAFAMCGTEYPAIPLDATDHHHSTLEGYYLAALVMDETLYHQSVVGAPTTFFNGTLTIPATEAKELQAVADQVAKF
jgi:hypothetical protein